MEFKDACSKINELISQSHGELILLPSGEEYSFDVIKKYTSEDISLFESKLLVNLPSDYKYFLVDVGVSKIYFDEYELGVEFITLENSEKFSEEVFCELDNNFPKIVIIASILNQGDFLAYIFNKISNKYELTMLSHEEPPEEWLDNITNVSSFDKWLPSLVECEGEEELF